MLITIFNLRCWYGIPTDDADKFDNFSRKCFPESFRTCQEFLRHKTFLINPLLLIKNKIPIHKAVQNPGEFIVTFAKSYHAGFNMGFFILLKVGLIALKRLTLR